MRRSLGPLVLILLGLILIVLFLVFRASTPGGEPSGEINGTAPALPALSSLATAAPLAGNATALATRTPQPVVPTATPVPGISTTAAEPTPSALPSPTPTVVLRRCPLPDCLNRSGVSGRLEDIATASEAGLPVGNFFDWWLDSDTPAIEAPSADGEPRYWQMVPVNQDGPEVTWSRIDEVVSARPGAIWIVGNEPDVTWQDNVTAETYAAIYHDVYTFIKERDPSAEIAIAGVAQPSPLRLAYLAKVLEFYQDQYAEPMPVDIWTIHAFILREQEDSWGVGIPPGMDGSGGLLYEITDHDDLEIFSQSLVSFRDWMADQGYGGKPLAVTEFGILHPADFGFPPPVIITFMQDAFDFMATAKGETGDPSDDYRLVQYWFWYSVHDSGDFPTGNLYDIEQEKLTATGQAYRHYLTGE